MPENNRPKKDKNGSHYSVPERMTAENFELHLTEEDIMANSVRLDSVKPERPVVPSSRKIYYTEKERKQEEKEHKKRNKLKARKNKRVFTVMWILMVLLVSFTVASYLIKGSNDFFAVDRPEGEAEVTIPKDIDEEKLAKILFDSKVINREDFFKLYSGFTVDDWKYFEPGVYKLPTNIDYEDIINRLQGGNSSKEEVEVLLREGLNVQEVAALMEENEVCSKEDFLAAANSADFGNYDMIGELDGKEGKYYKLEGYLFPDTYKFYKGEDVNTVIGKMLGNFQLKMTENEIGALVEQSGMSMDDVITLASIIQGEAADAEDMYNVSAVLHNRLDFGAEYDLYALQCDSTQYYPYRKDAVPEGAAFGNYDTYKISGLPAGGICNPGIDAIKAALNPTDENWLYFCHAADGTPYYAYTSGEHEENLVEAGLV